MQKNIPHREATGSESLKQRIFSNSPAVHGHKNPASAAIRTRGNVAAEPAFDSAPFIIVTAAALLGEFVTVHEPENIERAQVTADPVKIFDKFTVGHGKFSRRAAVSKKEDYIYLPELQQQLHLPHERIYWNYRLQNSQN